MTVIQETLVVPSIEDEIINMVEIEKGEGWISSIIIYMMSKEFSADEAVT